MLSSSVLIFDIISLSRRPLASPPAVLLIAMGVFSIAIWLAKLAGTSASTVPPSSESVSMSTDEWRRVGSGCAAISSARRRWRVCGVRGDSCDPWKVRGRDARYIGRRGERRPEGTPGLSTGVLRVVRGRDRALG
jgi:hypothetical protein